jgi:D-sedoheptulose 7-phosphate isomerase
MKEAVDRYFQNFVNLINSVEVSTAGKKQVELNQSIEDVCGLIKSQTEKGKKAIFIGNGGSAAIASHMAIDFWKNGGMKAIAFNDGSLLTCLGNDFGYQYVFEKPIEMFADEGDVLVAISSSGRSENILRGVKAARAKKCKVVTLSGFKKDNPLRSLGDYNYYVSSGEYGPVEIVHQFICHCILDVLMLHK